MTTELEARPKVEINKDALMLLNIEAKLRGELQYKVLSDIVMAGVSPSVREMVGRKVIK